MEVNKPNPVGRVSLGDMITRAKRRTPDKTAIIINETGNKISYRKINKKINRSAHAFQEAGMEKGEKIGFITQNSQQMLAAEYGALKTGLVPVLNNVGLEKETLEYQLEDADVSAVITDDIFYPKTKEYIEDNSLKFSLSINKDEGTPLKSFKSFIDGHYVKEPSMKIDGNDTALIMYTSGTTALPKGVVHSHRSYSWMTAITNMKMNKNHQDVTAQILPMFHIAETAMRATLMASGTTVIFRQFDPEQCLAAIERWGITEFGMMSSMYRRLFSEGDIEDYDLSSVQRCMYGMPMEMSMRKKLIKIFDCNLICTLGQTESGIIVYLDDEWQLEKPGNYVGWSGPFADVALMDEDGNLLSQGEIGEIVYRSPSVMEGYVNREEKTQDVWRYGWHHTEDIGKVDEDGQLVFVDRKKDIIKTGGENVSSSKVQNVLGDHPAVEESVVVGLPHDRWGEAITGFVVTAVQEDITAEEIKEFTKDNLASYETPKAIEFVNELPQTETGKIRRVDIREKYNDYYRNSVD